MDRTLRQYTDLTGESRASVVRRGIGLVLASAGLTSEAEASIPPVTSNRSPATLKEIL